MSQFLLIVFDYCDSLAFRVFFSSNPVFFFFLYLRWAMIRAKGCCDICQIVCRILYESFDFNVYFVCRDLHLTDMMKCARIKRKAKFCLVKIEWIRILIVKKRIFSDASCTFDSVDIELNSALKCCVYTFLALFQTVQGVHKDATIEKCLSEFVFICCNAHICSSAIRSLSFCIFIWLDGCADVNSLIQKQSISV